MVKQLCSPRFSLGRLTFHSRFEFKNARFSDSAAYSRLSKVGRTVELFQIVEAIID